MISNAFSQIHSISGHLINGLGTTERLDRVRVAFYEKRELIGSTYTDSTGYFLFIQTGVKKHSQQKPTQFQLFDNYPNPFNGYTTISYHTHVTGNIQIAVYNILGQKVRTVYEGYQLPGTYQLLWDGRDEFKNYCTMGTYFFVMKFNEVTHIKKMCLLASEAVPVFTINNTPDYLSKVISRAELTVQISDRDIADTTLTIEYDVNDSTLILGEIVVHVHPFVRTSSKPKIVMSGESVRDTLEIYHEKEVELSSQHAAIEWEFIDNDIVSLFIKKVETSSIYLRLNETGSSHVSYYILNYQVEPRLKIDRDRFRRGYLNIAYDDLALIRNNRGMATIQLISDLPQQLSFVNFKLSGNPIELFDDYVFFELLDDRNILVPDSVYLSIREPVNIHFNEYTIDVLEEYPRDGTHPYAWVNTYSGVTRNLYYLGELIANANPDGSKSCYCCGLTFEVFLRSILRLLDDLDRADIVNSMSVADMKYLLHLWFVERMWGDGPGVALERFGLGDRIMNWADVTKGDYLQFWRTSGSGHSVIFIDWLTSTNDDTIGIRYWSTQGSTNGINYSSEYFDGYGGSVDPDIVYFSRVRSPEKFEPFDRSKFVDYDEITSESYRIVPKYYLNNELN